MKNRLNLRKGQAGQILIFVTIVLALAAIVIPSFLVLTNASHRSTEINKEKTQRLYAADTGVEDALQKMGNGTFTIGNYTVPGSVNGYNVAVGIEELVGQSTYRITSTATDPLSGTHTDVVTEVPSYTLTINSSGGGNVTQPGQGTFSYPGGLEVALLAVPDACHDFVNWTGDVGTIDNAAAAATSITMNGNYTITANFEWQTSLTVSSTTGGRASVTPPGQDVFPGSPQTFGYCNGTTVNLLAIPDGSHNFVNWSGPVHNLNANSTYIVMNGDYEIQANFVTVTQYTLTVSHSGNGSVTSPGEGAYQYTQGTVVTLRAVANSGNAFVNWTGNTGTIGNVTAAFTTITMNGNYNITANFQQTQYNLNISHTGNGTVSLPGEGTYQYAQGAVVTLQAVANSGNMFLNWTGNTGTIGNVTAASTTITMNGNYSIVANFAIDSPCYSCWHYAVATLGGPGQNPFQNSGNINGDVYVNASAGLQNAFVLNGQFYVTGNLTLQNAINVNGNVNVQGNLQMSNSQRIYGNAYATGDITLQNSATITQSAYSQGSISLTNSSQITGDAHYQGSISMTGSSSVLGQKLHGPVTLPPFPTFNVPTASQINATATQYKNAAIAGGTITGDLTINSNTSLGPKYITGSLTIKNSTLTLTGTIYVEGTITLQNSSQIIMGSGGPYAIVANGNIIIGNSANVNAIHTSPLPTIMSVNGGITVSNSSNIGGIVYAPNGTITMSNSVIVYGSVVGLVVNTANSTVITHAPELDSRQGMPPCGCGS